MAGEQLLLINPRRRRRHKAVRRRRIRNVRRRRHVARRRRHHASRRVRRTVMVNPRRGIRRRRRRNPFSTHALTQDLLMPAALGAVGGIGLGMIWNAVSASLPAQLTNNTFVGAATQGAAAVGLGWAAGKALGKQKGDAVAVGALVVIGYNLLESKIGRAHV